jgi:hypothetical protein
MNTSASKLALFLSALAVSSLFITPVVRAADDPADAKAQKAAAQKAKHDAEVLKKYDKNGNGVLDPDEQAAKQANDDKMKALRDAKKRKAEERAKGTATTPAQSQQH